MSEVKPKDTRGYVIWFTRCRSYLSKHGTQNGAPTLNNAMLFAEEYEARREAEKFSYPSQTGQKPEPFEVNPVGICLLGDLAE